jgi:hypothetical protein
MILRFIIFSFIALSSNLLSASAISHGPIGVMADHFHKKGEWMVSFRVTNMEMEKNIFNGNSISTDEILKQPNPYASIPMMMENSESISMMNRVPAKVTNHPHSSEMKMPMKLSVVPKKMTMKMIMLGAMYAPSDRLTLMGMAMFNDKDMILDTYQGMMQRKYLGSFETSSSDLSKISFSALYNLHKSDNSRWHVIFGLEKSIGENSEKGMVLTPMNMKSSITLPYGMQSSDRALRLTTGITNVKSIKDFIIGNQLLVKKVIDEKDWNFGDEFEYNLWFQGAFTQNISYSLRLNYKDQDSIDGRDISIMAPVQTSNPNNYGGEVLNLGIGLNMVFNLFGGMHKDRFSIEILKPIDQNKNDLQMKDNLTIQIGFQKML